MNFQSLLLSVSINADTYKERIMNLALSASEELRQMAQEQEPLWLFDANNATEVLNESEYTQRFVSLDATLDEIIKLISTGEQHVPGAGNSTRPVLKTHQASRSIGIVLASPASLLDMLMDVEQWSSVFSNIVSKAISIGVLYPGEKETHNGALQVMTAEFYLPSPLFTPREVKFARFCRQIDYNTWIVTDVSLESLFPNQALLPAHLINRRPCGCLIQQVQPGLCMVTWVENNVAGDDVFVRDMFKDLLTSNSPFSSKRLIATMERYYDRMQSLERQAVIGDGNKNLLKLTQRMVRHYSRNVSERSWVALPIGDDDTAAEEIFVKTSINLEDDPEVGLPLGVALTICTSVWLPIPQNHLFDFLSNGCNRNKWDLLSIGSNVQDEMRISSARDPTNSVSVLKVESLGTKDHKAKIYLQESFTDLVAMYVVYAPVDEAAMQYILDGKDIDLVSILPSGFVILPTSPDAGGGSILTICFQIMDEHLPSTNYYHLPPKSVLTIHKIVRETVSLIKVAFIM